MAHMEGLQVLGLDKSYGEVRALRDVSFEVGNGELFGFVGSNGAGKTTAMRIILGVLAPDGGRVLRDGQPVDLAVRRRIGYMPEERGLYPKMRVGDQLVHLARLYGVPKGDAQAAMERWTERLGVASRRADEVQQLSLGNQQRVQLAAALVHDPEVLVLDEPFSGLDPVAVDVMSDVLRERAADGVPVVFSSHQLELVERLCDRVGIIRAGQMVVVDRIDALRRRDRPRWWVDGPPVRTWGTRVSEARVVSEDGSRTLVELPTASGAEQRVLAAALEAGPVREFVEDLPSLVDLYRDVVADDADTSGEDVA